MRRLFQKSLDTDTDWNYSSAIAMAMNTALKLAFFEARRTQMAVAHEIGIDDGILSKIIHGYIEPSDDQKKAIAKALRRKVHELFPEVAA